MLGYSPRLAAKVVNAFCRRQPPGELLSLQGSGTHFSLASALRGSSFTAGESEADSKLPSEKTRFGEYL